MSVARPTDIACREVVGILTDFLEGALDEQERTRVEQHLVLCPGCSEYLRQFRATIGTTRKLSEGDIPDQVKENLLDAFRHWRHGT
jgi:anti-sigma factor RsiW